MPNKILKSWSDKYDIKLSKLEDYWSEAIEVAEETFGKSKEDFKDKEYKYVMGVVKNMAKIKESKKGLTESFLSSKKDARSFIEEAVLSSNLAVDVPLIQKDEEEELEEGIYESDCIEEYEEEYEEDDYVEGFDSDSDYIDEDNYSEYEDYTEDEASDDFSDILEDDDYEDDII